jgi:hypothetical protein
MSARSSKGLKICISKGGATANALTPTAVSKAKPAEITVANTVKAGDIITIPTGGTGFPEIDGKTWVVGTASAAKFDLLGSDTTGSTGSLAGTPTLNHYADTDMECLCLSSIGISADEPGTISVGTYCDPTSTISSAAQAAGTLSFAGYVDVTDTDYQELLKAADDGVQRYMRIMLPSNGYIVAPLTFSSITWTLPLDGAVSYEGTAVLGSKPQHRF